MRFVDFPRVVGYLATEDLRKADRFAKRSAQTIQNEQREGRLLIAK